MELEPGYKQTEVGVIPEDWEVTLLDSVAKRGSGHTPDKAHPEYWGGEIKWVSLQDSDRLDQLYINDTTAKITPAGIANSSAKMHPSGTVVLSRDAGVGKSAIMTDNMAVSQHFMAWISSRKLNNHYLYYWLQSNKSEFERIAMGNTIKTIGLPYFKQLTIPLPTLAEQEAIAEALSDADALIESLEQLIAKQRAVKQGAMQELLMGKRRLPGFETKSGYKQTEVGMIPADWNVVNLSYLSKERMQNGLFFKPSHKGSGVKLINVGDLYSHIPINSDVLELFNATPEECERFKVQSGDLFFTRSSVVPSGIAHCNIYRSLEHESVVFDSHVIRLRPDTVKVDPLFLFRFCVASIARRYLVSHAKTATMTTIDQGVLGKCPVFLPTKAEQTAIAAVLSDMDAEIAALEAKLAKARQIKQGMMQELLTGRIRLVAGG